VRTSLARYVTGRAGTRVSLSRRRPLLRGEAPMRCAPQLTVLALLLGTLSLATALSAQQGPALVAGLRPSVALVDNQHDATLESIGFQVSVYVGRPFAPDFAGLLDLGVTTAH